MSGRASCTRFRGCARAASESVPEADGSSLAIKAATARSLMGGIIQAGPNRRLHRVDEVGQHRRGLLILRTERRREDDRRGIAGLAQQLGLSIPQLREIVVGGVVAVHPVPVPHQQILLRSAQQGLAYLHRLAPLGDRARCVGDLPPLGVFLPHEVILRIDELRALALMTVILEIYAHAARTARVTLSQRRVGAEVMRSPPRRLLGAGLP